jgi:tetratricopeptide (TPR) repeat protein
MDLAVMLMLLVPTSPARAQDPVLPAPAQIIEPEPGEPGQLILIPAQPPPAKQTKASPNAATSLTQEIERLKHEQESLQSLLNAEPAQRPSEPTSGDSAKRLRTQLDQMASEVARNQARAAATPKKVNESPPTPPAPEPVHNRGVVSELTSRPGNAPAKKSETRIKPADPIALGQVLLRMEDYDGAVRAFRAADMSKLRSEDRAYAQYLLATALRVSGHSQESLPLYREVANSRADPVIAECARWQLSLLQWRQDLETQLESLRQRRRTLQPSLSLPMAESHSGAPVDSKETP